MKWFRTRQQLHIRTLNGHQFIVTESSTVDLEALMANIISALGAGQGVEVLIGEEGIIWVRANQIESLWISR